MKFIIKLAFSSLMLQVLVLSGISKPYSTGPVSAPPEKGIAEEISIRPDRLRFSAKNKQRRRFRIIVGLNVPFKPIGRLEGLDKSRQRSAISMARTRFLTTLRNHKLAKIREFDNSPFLVLEVDFLAFLKVVDLLKSGSIASIQEDTIHVPSGMNGAPYLEQSIKIVQAPGAWEMGFTGRGQIIAILDTGIDSEHEFLKGKVKPELEACFSTANSSENVQSLCKDGVTELVGPGAGKNCSSPAADCAHGTKVAGIAAGRRPGQINPDVEFDGVAKDSKLVSIQVFSRIHSSTQCIGSAPCLLAYGSDIARGLQHVSSLSEDGENIASANISIGGPACSELFGTGSANSALVEAATVASGLEDLTLLEAEISNLRSFGVPAIVASGNDARIDSLSFPACIPIAISVGATLDIIINGEADRIAEYSNSAAGLSFLAPGSMIKSSVPGNTYKDTMQGTSFAAPHVAGAWAILKQMCPESTVDQISQVLKDEGVKKTDIRNNVETSLIQIHSALKSIDGSTSCVQ